MDQFGSQQKYARRIEEPHHKGDYSGQGSVNCAQAGELHDHIEGEKVLGCLKEKCSKDSSPE
jgi:hypothetical protein